LNFNRKRRIYGPKKTLKKERHDINPYDNTITDISGKSILISDADGSVKPVT
jgi:hypothetical protein